MTRTTTTAQTITEDNPQSVLSYRVGQLELGVASLKETVEKGQEKLDKKLNDLMLHFATIQQVDDVKKAAHVKHQHLWEKIDEVECKADKIQVTVTKIKESNVSFSLAQKAVFSVIGLILLAVATSLVNKVLIR